MFRSGTTAMLLDRLFPFARCWVIGALLLIALPPTASAQVSVETQDGLSLQFDKKARVKGIAIGGSQLKLRTGPNGFFVGDVVKSARNLLPGGDFGRRARGGWQFGSQWKIAVEDGSRFARALSTAEGSGSLHSPRVAVQPETAYLVAARVRTKSEAAALRHGVYIIQYDAAGHLIKVPFRTGTIGQIGLSIPRSPERFVQIAKTLITQPKTATIQLYANIYKSAGQFDIDDVRVEPLEIPPVHLNGTVRKTDQGAVVTANAEKLELELEATFTAKTNHIAVDGEIRDTSGADRLLQVGFSLPLDARRWTWWDDIEDSRQVTSHERYANYSGDWNVWHDRQVSVFPFASLTNEAVGLSLAHRVDHPRLFRLYYGASRGYCIDYSLGLTEATSKFPSSASFHFVIYNHDPAWGMRAAAKRYYNTFPESFEVRAKRQGTYCYDVPVDLPRPEDFGFCFDIAGFRNPQRRKLQDHGIYLLVHPMGTEAHLQWPTTHDWGSASGRPSREQIEDILTVARPEYKAGPTWNGLSHRYTIRGGGFDDARLRVLNSAIHGRDGRISVHPYTKVLSFIATSADPDLPAPNMAQGEWNYIIGQDARMARKFNSRLNGVDFDNITLQAGRVSANYRRDHFQYVDHPLVYDTASKRLCIHTGVNFHEFVKFVSDEMHEHGNLCTGNISSSPHTQTFFGHLLDKHGGEIHWNVPTRVLRGNRMMAYQKPVSHIVYAGVVAARQEETLMHRWLAFAEFPAIHELAYSSSSNFEQGRPLYKRFMPLMQRLAYAGWEPITLARLNKEGMFAERFGTWKTGNLYFTVHNDSAAAKIGMLTLDKRALGIPAQAKCTELLTGEVADQEGPIRVDLQPHRTKVFHLSS
jgi:hypothetical protein